MKAGPAELNRPTTSFGPGHSVVPFTLPDPTAGFCVPPNTALLSYWDTVADRLYKIRHCQNIEGVERQLAIFDPPIDPMLLVRAAAGGLDLSSVLSDLAAPTSSYRFTTMLQKAVELCGEVRSLGAAMLAALEKRDGEKIALLRSTHERALLDAVKQVKKAQVDEAQSQVDALEQAKEMATARQTFYSTREYMNAGEVVQLATMLYAAEVDMAASLSHQAAAAAHFVPDAEAGPTGMGVHGTMVYGGSNEGDAADSFGKFLAVMSTGLHTASSVAGLFAGFDRRLDDWQLQSSLADIEIKQIGKQIAAANTRLTIAQTDVENHQLQVDQAAEMEEALRGKYTNEELYSWTISQLATVYFQAYKLAYDVAKRAERCYQFERGLTNSGFIQFGYWDRLHKGLMAGERLALDLRRLELAWMDANRREYEITRNISLVLHDPAALLALRTKGVCEFVIPEEFFDADYPGHYFRRIKSVALTIPCVAGPYTPVNCTLSLLSSKIRISANPGDEYGESLEGANDDPRFLYNFTSVQSIATSHGQSDSGLFELNFRDERYLPFEGAGAVSRWRLSIPLEDNNFDINSLADVVMKLSFTAREGGERLRRAARTTLSDKRSEAIQDDPPAGLQPPLQRLFSLRNEYAAEWAKLRASLRAQGSGVTTLGLGLERFPFWCRRGTLSVYRVEILAETPASSASTTITLGTLELAGAPLLDGGPVEVPLDPANGPVLVRLQLRTLDSPEKIGTDTALTVELAADPDGLRDIWLNLTYTTN